MSQLPTLTEVDTSPNIHSTDVHTRAYTRFMHKYTYADILSKAFT